MEKKLANLIKGVLQFICVAGFIMAIPLPVSATSILIDNHSFEEPQLYKGAWNYEIPGWTIIGTAGVWNPQVGQSSLEFVEGIPDGEQVAWSEGPNEGGIIQNLSVTLTEGYKYTLTVWVGGRPSYSNKHYAVILAGGADLNSQTGVNIENEWNKVTVTYTAQPGDLNAGQQLAIKLMNSDGAPQLNFDKVELDASLALNCQGFLPPFDEPLTLKAKVSRAIPVKMVLTNLYGNIITDADIITPPVVNVSFDSANSLNYDNNLVPPGLSDDSNAFRYDPIDQLWIINLATKQFSSPGTYTVTVLPGDDSYVIEGCSQTFTRLP